MSEVKFYLEKRKDKATGNLIEVNVPILLFYSFNGMRLQYYSGYRIDKGKWDTTEKKVKKNYGETTEINKGLRSLAAKVEDIHSRANALGEIVSPRYFKDRLNGKKQAAKSGHAIWEYYDEYLSGLHVTHEDSTIKHAKSTKIRIIEFSKYIHQELTFDRIDSDFWQEFLDWCYNVKNYYNNYTGSLVRRFKTFLNWSVKKGYNRSIEFRDVKKITEDTEIIYLTSGEMQHFLNYPFTNNEYKIIRDLYCTGCFTGMRQQDVKKLVPENLQGDNIVFRIGKTKKSNIVPLNQYSRLLLKRNAGIHPLNCFPKVRRDYSQTLKNAMKEAGLERTVQIVRYKGAKHFDSTKPLWEVATPHTSKKSFVVGWLEGGGNLTVAMGITGNKSPYIMKRYYTIADTFKTTEMHRIYGK